jgi:hypothetical protein
MVSSTSTYLAPLSVTKPGPAGVAGVTTELSLSPTACLATVRSRTAPTSRSAPSACRRRVQIELHEDLNVRGSRNRRELTPLERQNLSEANASIEGVRRRHEGGALKTYDAELQRASIGEELVDERSADPATASRRLNVHALDLSDLEGNGLETAESNGHRVGEGEV